MTTKFILRRMFIGAGNQSIASSRQDYESLTEAADGLILALAIEEKFDILIANFAELERDLLNLALEDMIYLDQDMQLASRNDRMLLNRRLSNLLSSARMYRDQIMADLNRTKAWKATDLKTWVGGAMADAARTQVEFRACEALRNVAQHQEMPINRLVRSASRTPLGTSFTTQIFADVSAFSSRRSQDAKLEGELWPAFAPAKERKRANPSNGARNILLMPIVRRYVEILAQIHKDLQTRLSTSVAAWEVFVQDQVDKAFPVLGEHIATYAIAEETESGDIKRYRYLPASLGELRRKVMTRTSALERLADRYVVGRPPA